MSAVFLAGCTWPGQAASTSSTAAPETMQAVFVADGDTFTALDAQGQNVRVRLLGIDAPEAAHDGQPAQCGAANATDALRRLIAGRTVSVTNDVVADPVDRYGRRLAYIRVDGRDVALTLVQAGMAEAWYPASEPQPTHYPDYRAAERTARSANTWLWGLCETVGR